MLYFWHNHDISPEAARIARRFVGDCGYSELSKNNNCILPTIPQYCLFGCSPTSRLPPDCYSGAGVPPSWDRAGNKSIVVRCNGKSRVVAFALSHYMNKLTTTSTTGNKLEALEQIVHADELQMSNSQTKKKRRCLITPSHSSKLSLPPHGLQACRHHQTPYHIICMASQS